MSTYAEARHHICTGDLIGIATGTWFGRLIHALQIMAGIPHPHISHVGIALWMGSRLMIAEMSTAGNVIKPLSQYEGKRMVVCNPAPSTNLELLDSGIEAITKRHIPYGFFDLLKIGLRVLPSRFIDTKNWGWDGDKDKVCSLLPAVIYKTMGGDVSMIPTLAAPAEAVNALGVKFEIGDK
jgi:hypothetical protein